MSYLKAVTAKVFHFASHSGLTVSNCLDRFVFFRWEIKSLLRTCRFDQFLNNLQKLFTSPLLFERVVNSSTSSSISLTPYWSHMVTNSSSDTFPSPEVSALSNSSHSTEIKCSRISNELLINVNISLKKLLLSFMLAPISDIGRNKRNHP